MVSEYVRGPDLASLVAKYGPLDGRRQHAFAAGLAQALLSIHSVGLVHRDLKPANVLCAQRGLKVIDFGIASAADGASLTRTGLVVGTTGWMAPEQVNGEKVLPLTDIFCWASVVYYAATGLAPFGEGSPAAVLYRVVANDPDLSNPLDRAPAPAAARGRLPQGPAEAAPQPLTCSTTCSRIATHRSRRPRRSATRRSDPLPALAAPRAARRRSSPIRCRRIRQGRSRLRSSARAIRRHHRRRHRRRATRPPPGASHRHPRRNRAGSEGVERVSRPDP